MSTTARIIEPLLPTIALVGRVNVGKSTLFNRLTEKGRAIVSPSAGTTRTRNIELCTWRGQKMRLIDTGGVTLSAPDPLQGEIIKQIERAMHEADVIFFVVDGEVGVMPEDRLFAKILKKIKKPVRVVINKIDNTPKQKEAENIPWVTLGFGDQLFVSGINGRGTHEIMDEAYTITREIKKYEEPTTAHTTESIRVALIGRPNVGKSSMFNALIGQESVVVSDIPHTTREPFDTEVMFEGTPFVFIDTAGIRRKALIKRGIEFGGVRRSVQALRKADVALLVLETGLPINTQDKHLAGMIADSIKSIVIVVNKWDQSETAGQEGFKEQEKIIRDALPFLHFAPIVFVSAKTQARISKIFPLIREVYRDRHKLIEPEELEVFLKNITAEHRPSRGKGTRHPEILSLKQLHVNPPLFQIIIRFRTSLHRSYLHYIENRLREKFGFTGTPLVIKMKKGR